MIVARQFTKDAANTLFHEYRFWPFANGWRRFPAHQARCRPNSMVERADNGIRALVISRLLKMKL